jgi:DNA-binding MarR family transcriptional regulator
MEDTSYLKVVSLVERGHRHFLEVVKVELERLGTRDINNVQALMIFSIGDDEISVDELTLRGYYLGSNVSYNVKKMTKAGYLSAERSTHDLRSIRVKLSEKGRSLRDRLNAMYQRHAQVLGANEFIRQADLQAAAATLERLERFWLETRTTVAPL